MKNFSFEQNLEIAKSFSISQQYWKKLVRKYNVSYSAARNDQLDTNNMANNI